MVSDDRAQVLLLGGLAIAIVFLTAIPLSNSLVVSESASTSETVADIDRAAEREASVERGVRALVREADADDPATLNRALENFSQYYTNVSGQQDGVYVNATVNQTESAGNITEVYDTSDFRSPGGDSNNWSLSQNTDEIAVFNATITEYRGQFNFRVENNSEYFELRVQTNAGDTVVYREDSLSGGRTEVCRQDLSAVPGARIELDLVNGTCKTTSSPTTQRFDSYDVLDEPYTRVEANQGQNVGGSYRYGATGQFPVAEHGSARTRFLVDNVVDFTYVGPETSYDRTILVNDTS
ncbi:hypothetical protein [Haloarcula laminariae]|uniref:hypothetical protein n=1 Tax=Haloarcula laminariae TaxID=2961577 RepID=UPI0024058980|nr:hypothetical protein [Halomicroarcula sp. FL173]